MKGWDPDTGHLDPQEHFDAEPSPVPGIPQYRFDELAEDILWFGRLSLADRLAAIAEGQELIHTTRDWRRRVGWDVDGA